jgi:hypothetical protein
MHAPDMGRQLVLPVKSSTPSRHATSTGGDLTPEVWLVGSVQGCVVSFKLSLTSECLNFATFSITNKPAIAEYGADPCNNTIHLGYRNSGFVNLRLFLLGVWCITCVADMWKLLHDRTNCRASKLHALHCD